MRKHKNDIIVFAVLLLISVCPGIAHAQEAVTCGNVILPIDFYYSGYEEEAIPVIDCNNPFNADSNPSFTYGLTLNGHDVLEGSDLTINPGMESVDGEFFIDHPDVFTWRNLSLYAHDGNDYVAVSLDVRQEGLDNTRTNSNFTTGPLSPGTYTAVFTVEAAPILVEADSWWMKLLAFTAPTAEAFYPDSTEVASITFMIVAEEEKGASSVLFLPGIQASFLAKDALFGEDQVWPPNSLFNGDVEDLTMDETGQSREDIYTTGIIDSTTGVGNIYGGFAAFMNSLVGRGEISGWTPFAYDWRYSVDDIAKNGASYREGIRSLIDEVEYLAANSFSGQVTIIGHSNGGLLAKALLQELEAADKTDLIDKVIFLASPQLGTPKAIGTLLHGYDQTDALGGVIIDAHPTREVIQNMPGAYGLLPSSAYFSDLSEPLITFKAGESTNPYIDIYGEAISTYADYQQFLVAEDGLERSVDRAVPIPSPANRLLLDRSSQLHTNVLDNWSAPAGVEVIEVVGTGLTTMKAVEYRSIAEDKCTSAGPAGVVCVTEYSLKPLAKITAYGDGTVVQRSAEGYRGEKQRFFVNLGKVEEDNDTDIEYAHHNITEVPQLQNLYYDLITGTTSYETTYVSTTHTEFADEYDLEIIDSPVRILTTDAESRQTGVVVVDGVRQIRSEIPNSQYFEFGGTKYLIVPKGTVRETVLYGEDYGGYSLTTATLTGTDEQFINTELINAPVTPQTRVEYGHDGAGYSLLSTDLNGDGIVDTVTTISGEEIDIENKVTYQTVREYISSLKMKKGDEIAMLALLKLAEKASNQKHKKADLADFFLRVLKKLVHKQAEKGKLTNAQEEELGDMLEALIVNN